MHSYDVTVRSLARSIRIGEGENLLAVVEHGARVVSTVEDGVDVPGRAKTWCIKLLATLGSSGGVYLLVM